MAKKTKSKQRLDEYYHFAKTQGYRSRAAYKLIQINRKYNFLNTATAVIDLCAAPGGWMQVCANTMPRNSTIIGVDLDEIKKVPGTTSFKGDITKQQTFDRLRRDLKGRKCDAVLNDGAPNVGANWNKDAYNQSQLVLASFKLACDFLKEGGFFVTKVFRSTDANSLMWVFKKFFEKVEMNKPKASRFTSAEIFVVGVHFKAPAMIDKRFFDPVYVFKDTQADHFHDQVAGQITSIDKLLSKRRKRGGYEDNAPQHLYKETTLTDFIMSPNPILTFHKFNRITISAEERQRYYGLAKRMPQDIDDLFNDLHVLGKRDLQLLIKWRGKVRVALHNQGVKLNEAKQENEDDNMEEEQEQEIQYEEEEEEGDEDEDEEGEEAEDQEEDEQEGDEMDEQIEQQILKQRKKEIREIRQKQEKKNEQMIRAQAANEQLIQDQQFGNDHFDSLVGSDEDIENIGYVQNEESQQIVQKLPKYVTFNQKEMEENLQEMYELKQQKKKEKMDHAREVRDRKKQRREQRALNADRKLKSRRFGHDDRQDEEQDEQVQEKNNKQQQKKPQTHQNDVHQFKFKNPLAMMDDEDIYISENQEADYQGQIDPNERMEGQLSDDENYVIPKPMSDMEKRRKRLKKNEEKKKKKLHKDIEDGQDVGGQIEIVPQKTQDDYNIDDLAETLVIAKKMLRNHSREQIIDESYGRFNFEDHDDLPKWFTEDQKKHNFKKLPITKEQFKQEKQRLMAINARVPKKILQAKVRRKIRIQKKLKKTQKKAETVMSQQGINEVSKLRQIGKMYDKSKRELKDHKKYVVGKKSKGIGGKDSRKVKHVDSRLKKDKRSMSRKIKKTRHVKRSNSKKGRF